MTIRLHHVALSVRDLEESIAWYADIFGFRVLSRQTIPHNGWKIAFIGTDVGEACIELLAVHDPRPLPEGRSLPDEDNLTLGVKHFCVAVDDNVEFTRRAREKGVKVVFEPPAMPGGYVSFINDPTGNIIEIFQLSYDVSTKSE
jgi:lactoylglutathione lyase